MGEEWAVYQAVFEYDADQNVAGIFLKSWEDMKMYHAVCLSDSIHVRYWSHADNVYESVV